MMQNRLFTFSFKKLIKIVITILLCCLCMKLLDGLFIPKYVNENIDGRITSEFYREKEPLDLIVFGSSTVYNAIVPSMIKEDMGINSYLRANASQTLWQSYYLLEDALISEKPEVVMLDVSFMKNGEEFIEEPSNRKALEGMRLSPYKIKAIKASQYSEEHWETYLFPVFRYHSRWKELTGDDLKYMFYVPTVTDHGYIKETGVAKDQHIYEIDPEMENSLKLKLEGAGDNIKESGVFPDKSIQYLDLFVNACAKNNIKLILFKTPTYVNTWYDTYDKWMENYVNQYNAENCDTADDKQLCYVNFDGYKEDCGLNVETDYIDDGEHLNYDGAVKYTAVLEKYLEENCFSH